MADQLILRESPNLQVYALIDLEKSDAVELHLRQLPSDDDFSHLLGIFDLTALSVGLYDGSRADGSLDIRHDKISGMTLSADETQELCEWGKMTIVLGRPSTPLGSRSRLSTFAVGPEL